MVEVFCFYLTHHRLRNDFPKFHSLGLGKSGFRSGGKWNGRSEVDLLVPLRPLALLGPTFEESVHVVLRNAVPVTGQPLEHRPIDFDIFRDQSLQQRGHILGIFPRQRKPVETVLWNKLKPKVLAGSYPRFEIDHRQSVDLAIFLLDGVQPVRCINAGFDIRGAPVVLGSGRLSSVS
jgi:hypothetical protein